jgi:RluA family pseudouridine synthase
VKKKPLYEILFQDDSILVVSKAPGLAVLSGRGRTESLLGLLGSDPNVHLTADAGADASHGTALRIVHRIDAETSGVLVLAKTHAAQKALSEQFSQRTVKKEYLALVRGTPLQESGSVDLPIGVDPKDKTRMVIRGDDAKKCRTKWIVDRRFAGVTLLRVFPVTGRRHQIRVHLKAMGYPLAVDPLYGGTELKLSEFKRGYKTGKYQEERPLLSRLSLHARGLTFVHPETGAVTVLEAPLPKDFRGALEALEKWAGRAGGVGN